MNFIDEYRHGEIARRLTQQIARLTDRRLKVMEVCGGHTHTIFKYGIEDLLPLNIEMIHDPGCPVCVIPLGRVDDSIYRLTAGRDLHHLRRHDARARIEDEPAQRQGRRRGREPPRVCRRLQILRG